MEVEVCERETPRHGSPNGCQADQRQNTRPFQIDIPVTRLASGANGDPVRQRTTGG